MKKSSRYWVLAVLPVLTGTASSQRLSQRRDADHDFVTMMLPHHEIAIEMARTELLHGKDSTIRRLAQEVITDQQSEIELMRLWLRQHPNASSKTSNK